MAREIVWNDKALEFLATALEYISQNSALQANKVEKGIIEHISKAAENPERFPPDQFKKNNPGNYRAFESYKYRVAYTYTDLQIQILNIRHVKQKPLYY